MNDQASYGTFSSVYTNTLARSRSVPIWLDMDSGLSFDGLAANNSSAMAGSRPSLPVRASFTEVYSTVPFWSRRKRIDWPLH